MVWSYFLKHIKPDILKYQTTKRQENGSLDSHQFEAALKDLITKIDKSKVKFYNDVVQLAM